MRIVGPLAVGMRYPDIVLMTHHSGTAHLPFAEPILDGNDATGGSGHHPVGPGTPDSQQIDAPGRLVRSEIPEHLDMCPIRKWKAIQPVTLRGRAHPVRTRRP